MTKGQLVRTVRKSTIHDIGEIGTCVWDYGDGKYIYLSRVWVFKR